MNPTNGMNNAVTTGAITFSTGQLIDTLHWLAPALPDSTLAMLAGAIFTLGHLALSWLNSRIQKSVQ